MVDYATFGTVDDSTLKRVYDRFANYSRRTLNNGLGLFFVYAIALTTFVITAWFAVQAGISDQGAIARFFDVQTQPSSEITNATAFSLIASELTGGPRSLNLLACEFAGPDCAFAELLWTKTQRLVDLAGESRIKTACSSETDIAAMRGACLELEEISNGYEKLPTLKNLEPTASADSSCGDSLAERLRADRFLMSPPRCSLDSLGQSALIIPHQSADTLYDWLPMTEPSSAPQWTRVRDYRLRRSQLDAQLFSLAVKAEVNSLPPLATAMDLTGSRDYSIASNSAKPVATANRTAPIHPDVIAAYFLTIDSVLQYWTRLGYIGASHLPTYHLWSARPYFEATIADAPKIAWSTSKPYLDIARHGIVWTRCREITAIRPPWSPPPLDEQYEQPTSRYIAGLLCVDYAISVAGLDALVKRINQSRLATASLLKMTRPPDGKWHANFISGDEDLFAASLDDYAVQSNTQGLEQGAGTDVVKEALRKRPLRPDVAYRIPARFESDNQYYAILVAVGGIGPLGSRPALMLTAFTALAIVLWSVFAGARSSRQIARRDSDLARLRSLQIGVIETDLEDLIVSANDHAEDIIGRRLPIIGAVEQTAADTNLYFWALFDEHTILREEPGGAVEEFELISRKDLEADRRSGDTYAYFVKLVFARQLTIRAQHGIAQADRSWVRLNAGPIFGTDSRRVFASYRRSDLVGTFGTLQYVKDSKGNRLSKRLEMQREPLSVDEI